jgi:hypothetical protein
MKNAWIAMMFLSAAVAHAQSAPAIAPPQNAAQAPTLVVLPGTMIPLTLVSQIKSKSTKPGDSVRAVVAFPVTVGTQVAIPAGTYVEGMVQSVKLPAHGSTATVQIHFTRLLFANGYGVALDAMNTQAMLGENGAGREVATAGGAPLDGTGYFEGQQTYPTPPPLPHVGPPEGAIIGGSLAGVGVIVVIAAVTHHHNANADYVLFDNGWQFQMALVTPLTLDAAKVASATGDGDAFQVAGGSE